MKIIESFLPIIQNVFSMRIFLDLEIRKIYFYRPLDNFEHSMRHTIEFERRIIFMENA